MNMRVVTDPFNSGTKEVDAQIGNAYPVVKRVYDNLVQLLYLAENATLLTAKDIELNSNDELKVIQWRYVGDADWRNLVTYNDLLGADIPALIIEINELQEQMNETAAEIEAAVPIVLTARDQALQAVIDAANASRLTVGTVTEGAVDVTITGPAGAQVINFVVPKGEQGDPNTLTIGTVTEGPVAEATITGEAPDQFLSLVLPRGSDGDTPDFVIGTVETGSPGTPVEVTISGTAPDYTLNFKIPQGDSGAGTGDMLNSDNLGGLTDYAIARTNLGLGNVNNTSDVNKPVSTAQQTALDLKANSADVTTSLTTKVDKVAGKQLSTNDFTDTLKTKIEGLNEHYRGTYTSLAALQAAVPTGQPGDVAIVDAGTGVDAIQYLWDNNDTQWIQGGGVVTSTDVVPEGSTNKYFTVARVLASALTGLSLVTGTAIVATDSVLDAFGKLQKQITDLLATVTTQGTAIAAKVGLAGAENITGVKTFTASPLVPNIAVGTSSGASANAKLVVDSIAAIPPTGPTGGGSDKIFLPFSQAVNNDFTLADNTNYLMVGPVTINGVITFGANSIVTLV